MASSMHERTDPANCIRIAPDVRLGRNVALHAFVNLYGCQIGDDTRIGSFVEIQKNVSIGARCKIQSHTFVCEGVTIEDEVFVGHGVMFINDLDPRATADGRLIAGIIREQTETSLVIQTANERIVVPREDIEAIKPSSTSMMPEGLLEPLSPREVRDLFAYLASTSQVPLPPEGKSDASTK